MVNLSIIFIIIIFSLSFWGVGNSSNNVDMNGLWEFLLVDETDRHVYIDGEYMCGSFTKDLITNASYYGIRLYPIMLYGKGNNSNHILAAARINNSIVFIEPQQDTIFCGVDYVEKYYDGYHIGEWIFILPDKTGVVIGMHIAYCP